MWVAIGLLLEKNVVLELKIKELETCDITSGYVPADNISKTN